MIEKIYIPTYGRIDSQLTYHGLPDKWKEKTILVIAASEEDKLQELGYKTAVCPCQGPAPAGEDSIKYGISPTREWIHGHAGKHKYAVMDDDIQTFLYEATPEEKAAGDPKKAVINYPVNSKGERGQPAKGYEDYFDRMMSKMSSHLNEVVTAGLDNVWTFPKDSSHQYNFRQTIIHFINGETFPDGIDWVSIKLAEDYYVLLQLMTKGYQNIIEHRFRIGASGTQTTGGCETYRTIDNHNEAMHQLQAAFPDFVKLRPKAVKSGPWTGQDKLAATISWKKAYESSQKKANNMDWAF